MNKFGYLKTFLFSVTVTSGMDNNLLDINLKGTNLFQSGSYVGGNWGNFENYWC